MPGMEEAIKNLMMQRAMQGGGAPTGGSAPMAPGGQGMPMPSAGGDAMPMAAGAPGGGMPAGGGAPQINPALLKAVMAARAGGGKSAPAARGKAAPAKGKPSAKGKAAPKGKAPAKGGKGKPIPKKAAK